MPKSPRPASKQSELAPPQARAPQARKGPTNVSGHRREPQGPTDIALLHGPTEDGEGARLLRMKEGKLWAGEVRPVREGQAIHDGELVRLRPLSDGHPICEVETLYAPARDLPAKHQRSAGPARVSNETYRKNWSTVFGSKRGEPREHDDWSVN